MNKHKKKDKKENKIKEGLIKFFNNPVPIIIVLIVIITFLLIFISKSKGRNVIGVGEINQSDVIVSNIHYFINNDMNYFYAAPAQYIGDNKEKIYSFEIGYYVKINGEYVALASRSNSSEKGAKLSEILEESSSWNFAELASNDYFFSDDIIKNIESLHFRVKASTNDDDEAEITIDYPVEITKITK